MEKRYVEVKSCDLTLRGYLELPDGASSESPVPLLVMFHGFTGTLSEKHFVLSRLSRRVVASGVATLRFDFGGSGFPKSTRSAWDSSGFRLVASWQSTWPLVSRIASSASCSYLRA